jgi:hypothetical protein
MSLSFWFVKLVQNLRQQTTNVYSGKKSENDLGEILLPLFSRASHFGDIVHWHWIGRLQFLGVLSCSLV